MARPSYSLNIPGVWSQASPDGSNPTSGVHAMGLHAQEDSVGTSRRRKPTGWVPPTGYQLDYFTYRRAVGICENRSVLFPNGSGGQIYKGCVGGSRFNSLDHFNMTVGNSYNALMDLSLISAVEVAARLKIKGKSVDLGVAWAERNQTARLIGDTAKRIARAFNFVKRGQILAAMRVLRGSSADRRLRGNSVPQKWLELQYGWKPFLSDIFGACEALSKHPRGDWRITGKAQKTNNRTFERKFDSVGMGLCVAKLENGAFCRIDALPSNDLTMSLSSVGVTNPLLIAWELVPFSFVVDWAFAIGDWLDSLDAFLGFGNVDISTTTYINCVWNDTGLSGPNGSSFFVNNNYQGSQKVIRIKRSTKGAVIPTFPGFKDPVSFGHMANGLALLSQAFSRR